MKVGNLVRFYPSFIHTGGGERARTDGLLRARQALSQLSYTPVSEANRKYQTPVMIDLFKTDSRFFQTRRSSTFYRVSIFQMVGLDGIEPSTSRLSGVRSNRTELQALARY